MKKIITLSVCAFALGFALPAMAEEGVPPEGKGGPFAKHDTNGDGVISKSEFLSHAEERFGEMDADGSGEVTKEEAKAAHEAKREKMKEMRGKFKERREGRGEKAE
ncbi:MAG: hypothetical protein ACRBCT_01080 [Alphaproteobacteria bacterium]